MSCCLSCFIVPATWNSDAATATDMVRRSSLPAACTRCRMFVAVMIAVASRRSRKVCCPQCRSTRGGGGGPVVLLLLVWRDLSFIVVGSIWGRRCWAPTVKDGHYLFWERIDATIRVLIR